MSEHSSRHRAHLLMKSEYHVISRGNRAHCSLSSELPNLFLYSLHQHVPSTPSSLLREHGLSIAVLSAVPRSQLQWRHEALRAGLLSIPR